MLMHPFFVYNLLIRNEDHKCNTSKCSVNSKCSHRGVEYFFNDKAEERGIAEAMASDDNTASGKIGKHL